MTTREKLESLIDQVIDLPKDAQAEFVESLFAIQSQHLGIYHLDDDQREALARDDA
jgi:hypothetical protein